MSNEELLRIREDELFDYGEIAGESLAQLIFLTQRFTVQLNKEEGESQKIYKWE